MAAGAKVPINWDSHLQLFLWFTEIGPESSTVARWEGECVVTGGGQRPDWFNTTNSLV